MKLCCKPDCGGPVHLRRCCFDHWVQLCRSEAKAITKPRREKLRRERPKKLFMEARAARLAGDMARHAFIKANGALPEDRITSKPRKGYTTFRGESLDRTFVSEAELNEGTGRWCGYDYFGDVSRVDWPEREPLGMGGRNTSRMKK